MTVIKGPNEVRTYRINFANVPEILDQGESVASIASGPSVSNGETGLTVGAGSVSSNKVTTIISGGTENVTYEIYTRVTTTAGNQLDSYWDLRIEKTKS